MKRKAAVFLALVCMTVPVSCGSRDKGSRLEDLKKTGSMELQYAEHFSVDYCEGGCSLVTAGEEKLLIVPEGAYVPAGTEGITVIKQPVENVYMANSAAMDLADGIGCLDRITMTSTPQRDWTLPAAVEAMDRGDIAYIGKYSAPDYEALVGEDCGLAVENTMILHNPQVKEKIEELGIPVMIDLSSYESHPLGRMEWLRLYGLIFGVQEEADRYFAEKTSAFGALDTNDIPESEKKTAAFFYISPNGYVNIRKPKDYVSEMIRLAGGKYIFTADDLNVDENALSTMNIQLETFYEAARDADVLIYNSTVEGRLDSMEQFLEKSPLLADMKAVREGNVWCTEQNMFQQTTGAADMIADMERIFSGEADGTDQLTYLHRLS